MRLMETCVITCQSPSTSQWATALRKMCSMSAFDCQGQSFDFDPPRCYLARPCLRTSACVRVDREACCAAFLGPAFSI
jgi:hypothetical protein